MKLKFEDLRVGDVLRNVSGSKPGDTIKVASVRIDTVNAGTYGTFTKGYLEEKYEFVKRTKFEIGDKVRLVRSTKKPYCRFGWGSGMNTYEKSKQVFEVDEHREDLIGIDFKEMIGTTTVEPIHLVPVFESEVLQSKENTLDSLDSRITELEEKMDKYEIELKELKQAKITIMTYL